MVSLYVTAVLMALVAAACTALCLMWTVPAWRRRLAAVGGTPEFPTPEADGLRGWPARVGSGLVSVGIGTVAFIAWYGLYSLLAAL